MVSGNHLWITCELPVNMQWAGRTASRSKILDKCTTFKMLNRRFWVKKKSDVRRCASRSQSDRSFCRCRVDVLIVVLILSKKLERRVPAWIGRDLKMKTIDLLANRIKIADYWLSWKPIKCLDSWKICLIIDVGRKGKREREKLGELRN
jgi:hypothetical protein